MKPDMGGGRGLIAPSFNRGKGIAVSVVCYRDEPGVVHELTRIRGSCRSETTVMAPRTRPLSLLEDPTRLVPPFYLKRAHALSSTLPAAQSDSTFRGSSQVSFSDSIRYKWDI